jgi:hypothetical protein
MQIGYLTAIANGDGFLFSSKEVQSALEDAGLTGATVSAEAFGENCITGIDELDHFATMETDVRISLEVPDLTDTVTLGDLLERILVVLDAFPDRATPGPQPGYIGCASSTGQRKRTFGSP